MQNMSTFVKYHGNSCQLDMDRVERLYAASLASRKFLFPRPLRIVPDKMEIVYEHLPRGRPLYRHVYGQSLIFRKEESSNIELFERIGRALASIHQYLIPKSTGVVSISYPLGIHSDNSRRIKMELLSAPIVGFHGDFGLSNIWLRSPDKSVVVIDPIPSKYCPSPTAGRASVYYDISQMVAHLWCIYPFWLIPVLDQARPSVWINAFLKGYQQEYGIDLHVPTVQAVTLWHLDLYLSNWLGRETSWFKKTARTWYTNLRRRNLIGEQSSIG